MATYLRIPWVSYGVKRLLSPIIDIIYHCKWINLTHVSNAKKHFRKGITVYRRIIFQKLNRDIYVVISISQRAHDAKECHYHIKATSSWRNNDVEDLIASCARWVVKHMGIYAHAMILWIWSYKSQQHRVHFRWDKLYMIWVTHIHITFFS